MTWGGGGGKKKNLKGYLTGTGIFLAALAILVWWQIRARKFHPFLYWGTIVASTTAGTTMADFADRSLGIGYTGGTTVLLLCVVASLALWHKVEGSVSVATVSRPRVEVFYWLTITFSQTLGTALGDWMADDTGLGYLGGAAFSAALALVAAGYFWTKISRVTLFWAAFILTRRATLEFLDRPLAHGGLGSTRPMASLAIAATMLAGLMFLPQRPGRHPREAV